MSTTPYLLPRPQISQVSLENILTLEGQIAELMKKRDRIAADVLEKLANKSDIEEGARAAAVDVDFVGMTRTETLKVW